MEIMICFCFLLLIWAAFTGLGGAQQFYDPGECSENTTLPGSQYTCSSSSSNAIQNLCHTFMVYRACQHFQTISNISGLFDIDQDVLLQLNNLTSSLETLKPGREVLVPINCSCSSGRFSVANFSYYVTISATFPDIACGVFEGLLKSMTLIEENPPQGTNLIKIGTKLHVPLKCACPDNFTSGIKYLVTYPFIEGDETITLGKKFGIPPEDIWAANHLEPIPTVYPNTTILVPLKTDPVINFDIPDTQPPLPGFLPTYPTEKTAKSSNLRTVYIAGPVAGFSLVVIALLGYGFYLKVFKKWKKNEKRIQSFTVRSSPISCSTGRSSTNSCLSPEILVGLKYSLCSYSTDELKKATGDFGLNNKVEEHVYKGLIDNVEVMIKRLRFEDTRQIIDLHSKINHINIVKLIGVCYGGETDLASWSYLVFEFPRNGSLRDCLSNATSPLQWLRRTQIAFDIATGLHYLHYCTFPTYTHTSLNSRNIFVTMNWRAKLTIFGAATTDLGSSNRHENGTSVTGWVAPEYHLDGLISEKVDIFAFGVVLLELISAREDMDDGELLRDSIGFLKGGGGASEGGCFEQLRHFMDPCLKEDYPLAEALCLAVLAKACVEDDPLHRPSMDDIMKVLARMV